MLTEKELELVALLRQGLSVKEAATRLSLARVSAYKRLERAMKRVGVSSFIGLVEALR